MRPGQAMSLCLAISVGLHSLVQARSTATLTVTATVLSQSNCRFATSTATLNFGTIDPAGLSAVSTATTVTFQCTGSAPFATFFISHDSGLHETAAHANRMRHTTVPTAFLPYQVSVSPQTGTVVKNVDQTVTLTGMVQAIDYHNVRAGSYADTVVMTISP